MVEANRKLERLVEASLKQTHGLTRIEFEALVRLGRSPDRQTSMSDLAGQMVLTSGGITRLIDRLAGDDLVERASCPSDRRVQWAHLTEHGLATVSQALATHLVDLDAHFFSAMSPDEQVVMTTVLDRLRSSCDESWAQDRSNTS